MLISFYLTFARGAYLALIFSLIITILLFIDFSKSNVRLSLVIFLWLLMISFFSINLIASNLNLHKSANLISGRDIYWQEALKNFQTKPLTGTGLNTYKIVSFKQTKKGILKTDSAHNFFLQMLSDGGILLFLSSIGLVVSLIISIFKKIKQVCRFAIKEQKKDYFLLSLWVGFVSSILYNLVDIGWQLPFCFLIFWIISAILIQDENHLKQS